MSRPDQKLRCSKEPYIEDVGPRKLKSVQFCRFSGDDIRKQAEVQVWASGKLYDEKQRPIDNGLLDLRMGVANKRCVHNCGTCHGDYIQCPGHFGYLKLTLPVFNVGFFNQILDVMKCICKGCGRLLLEEKERKEFLTKMRSPRMDMFKKDLLMKKIRDKCKGPRCHHCPHVNGTVKKARSAVAIVHDLSKTVERKSILLTPVTVLSLFRKMEEEDCEVLNLYDRPEKLIVTDIAVPPAAIRPSAFVDKGSSNEDGLTSILKNIMNTNSILREDIKGGAPEFKCQDCWNHLQMQVVEYVNSEAPSVVDSKNRGIIQRLKGKTGRFRGNLSGKRVEFTGRTVISPDPNLKITEVAIPVLMARVLTYPERVSSHNIEKLRQCVLNGPSKYPGANFITLPGPNGYRMDLKYTRKDAANELKYGSIVHRHLEDGDIVLFNRQPSLHRMSIMSHRARIKPWRTLRFNESVCNPYNADFDGDEMNMHVPQTEEARTEALILMGVQNNLCTPKNGEILVASTQDFLTSSFLITRKDTFYDRAAFSLICSYMGDAMDHIDLPTPALIKPIELWTGKQLFSVLVRPNASTRVFLNLTVEEKIYTKNKQAMCPNDGFVYFRNSELLSGQIGKATIGNGRKDGLFSVLLRDYNTHAAASCMNRVAKLSARWIGNHGFSIGINDVQAGEFLNQKSKQKMNDVFSSCDALTTVPDSERDITNKLSAVRDITGKVCMEELHWRNSPKIMSQCGSKGSPINISQMIICVGQQTVGGARALDGFINRTLPHFPINLKIPAAKGFVANSFYTGLTATEFFFHTMGGREGLVDTAVKTATTGYMSRRLVKSLEDLSVFYDFTVRDASGAVVQFHYGDDGMDPMKMEGNDGIPLDLHQLFMKVKATCPCGDQCVLSRSELLRTVDERLEEYDMSLAGGCSAAFKESLLEFLHNLANSSVKLRKALQLDENPVAGKDDILESVAAKISGISRKQIEVFLNACISRYHSKKVEAGSAIGAIGAQSIGEPGTQMTLKTFHFAGVASMNVTLGVPRISEIINASKNISRPLMEVILGPRKDEEAAKLVKAVIQKTVLGEVAKSIKNEGSQFISVVLDSVHMGVSSESVRESILRHPKIKLKPEHIRVLSDHELRIYPSREDKGGHLFNLHKLKTTLPNVIVKGIPTAELVEISKGHVKGEEVCKVYVQGTNLLEVMGTPGVDGTKTQSNHIMEVVGTIGIEAARQMIIDEIQMNMKNYNMTIDIRHMMLLADVMTYKGEVLGATRYGISKMKESVLMLAAFEKTAEHLFNASFKGRVDQIDGVTECIITGNPVPLGTGLLKVRQRVEELPELHYGPEPILVR